MVGWIFKTAEMAIPNRCTETETETDGFVTKAKLPVVGWIFKTAETAINNK